MRCNFALSLLLAGMLALGALAPEALADSCEEGYPCESRRPGLIERLKQRQIYSGEEQPPRLRKLRRRLRRNIETYPEPSYGSEPSYGDDQFVQTYGEDAEGLIGPTEALTQALAAVPNGKPLGVKLLRGPAPVYAVKLRVRGKVRRILVDARTAQIVGE
jgi:uncharacterized membrane protein YkoI